MHIKDGMPRHICPSSAPKLMVLLPMDLINPRSVTSWRAALSFAKLHNTSTRFFSGCLLVVCGVSASVVFKSLSFVPGPAGVGHKQVWEMVLEPSETKPTYGTMGACGPVLSPVDAQLLRMGCSVLSLCVSMLRAFSGGPSASSTSCGQWTFCSVA
ncbi:hypothetical protein D9M72_502930 [compost metagenome]